MSNVTSAENYLQFPAAQFRGSISSDFFYRIGGSLNYVLDKYVRTYSISGSSGTFSTSSTSLTTVTGMTATITTTGRPVLVLLIPDGSGNSVQIGATSAPGFFSASLYRDSTQLGLIRMGFNPGGQLLEAGGFNFIETPAAGTYTYSMQVARAAGGANFLVSYTKLLVIEL